MPDGPLIAAYAIFLASYVVFALGKFLGMKIAQRPLVKAEGGPWAGPTCGASGRPVAI